MFFWLIWLIDASVALHDVVRFEKAYQDIYPPELELKHENFYLLKSLLYTQKSKKKRNQVIIWFPKLRESTEQEVNSGHVAIKLFSG